MMSPLNDNRPTFRNESERIGRESDGEIYCDKRKGT